MRRTLLLLLGICVLIVTQAQKAYWQQRVNYTIDVSLDDKQHSLDGFEKIIYTNNSPDTLRFIWFHLWPNAYKTDQTAFSDQLLENGNTRFYFSEKEERGYINRLAFKVDNTSAETKDHPQHIDIIQVILPSPLAPGGSVSISTPFHVKLPYNFSRGGHDAQSYQVTQWYPKPAVYDATGWHPIPYLDQGEFYSEFGNYDVTISLPANYVVAATGVLQDAGEKEWLLQSRSRDSWGRVYRRQHRMRNYDTLYDYSNTKPRLLPNSKIKSKVQGNWKLKKTKDSISNVIPPSEKISKTISFKAENVHDFAWFADKRFIVDHDTAILASGRVVDLFSYYTPREMPWWKNSLSYAKETVKLRSEWIGEYPYPVLSVVQGPASFGGGMEYPTITSISPLRNEAVLGMTIAHEIGHNWFYGILASNEREHPWLDEGLNSYYDHRYANWKYGNKGEIKWRGQYFSIENLERLLFEAKVAEKTDQPINTSSEALSSANYGLIPYYKTAAWLKYIESKIGTDKFDHAMQQYYADWKFKHPQPADLKTALESGSGQSLDSAFLLLNSKGAIPGPEKKGLRAGFLFNPAFYAEQVRNPAKSAVLYTPAIGLNSYDKLMLGALFTNMVIPSPRFQFLVAPMYAFGSKTFTGTGLASMSFFPDRIFHKIDIGVSAATFSINEITDEEGNKLFLSVRKLVPGIRFTFQQANPRSTIERFIQFKTFLIGEDALGFYRDTVVDGVDTVITDRYRKVRENRTLNQLKFVIENYRALYPYRAELNLEQGKGFVRAAFTGNYFFNYAKGGGLSTRLFAGKFFYSGTKTFARQFETDRYHLNMTGPNGYEDYTYSDYFAGRNEFEGAASQQIMMRDGAFKVRTDLLASKVGRTDDWLVAANLSSTIPANLNPLSVLPFKIPLKVFVDIGTYAEAWKRNANTDRFLFDAGLQLPLLKESINIYLPLIYSKVFKDYLKSTIEKKGRFFKTISFSINVSTFNFRNIRPKLNF